MKNNDVLAGYLSRGTLVAAHRGVAGGNIPFNTIAAFEAALLQGADIIETDVIKSIDGEVFIFHINQEINHLNRDIHLTQMTADEIRKVRYVNFDNNLTEYPIPTLDETLECLKDRCLINLDHCWEVCFKETIEGVRRHNMQDQVLIKTPSKIEHLKMVEELAPDFMYISLIKEEDKINGIIESMNINYVGAELVFTNEQSPVLQSEYIEMHKKKGRFLWANAIIYNYKTQLSAGHTDDIAVAGDMENGWGWLVDAGFDIIQTDWPMMLKNFLNERRCNK